MTELPTVWIVDDDEAIRFVLERALSRAGYAVESFTDVQSVSGALESGAPHVLVTDIRLPDADGQAAWYADWIRHCDEDADAWTEGEYRRDALEAEAEEIVRLLEDALRAAGAL